MSIEQVKKNDIRAFLAQAGITPVKETPSGGMYLSPLRKEDTASFHVDYTKNLWYDHGAGVGGSIIDLVMRMYQTDFSHAVSYLEAPDLSRVQ
ncbi:CHC2 zinc finger domain-containing protein [Rikenella microfusus]|uniref:CHC2 zinc finger domain-containing protein n=1 Tax=Rikenella microfusus TaxID=28139 RepID=UPI003A8D80FF